ncbi:DMT family transporter [Burkholderia sp. Leaf177]|uniref:DMT family transporter n=1 Tax=Burkholderia sp. Leaf177 TaxID=1736287 RepID=UPI000AEBD062|nr:DMT family transporter [Burkholderia sp. Leaf177]
MDLSFIILGGVLQAAGAPINGVLKASLVNPWLASAVSFMLVTFLAIALFWIQPTPLPTLEDLKDMKWWAPLGGIVGAVAVFAGLTLVQKVGVGAINGLTICANLLATCAWRRAYGGRRGACDEVLRTMQRGSNMHAGGLQGLFRLRGPRRFIRRITSNN